MALATGSSVAMAQPTEEPDPPAEAPEPVVDLNEVFRKGLERFDAGAYDEAVRIWERLVETLGKTRGRRVLYNLGLAYERLGNPTRAVESYSAFASEGTENEARRTDALRRADELKAKHGALTIRAPGDDSVVLVRIGQSEPRSAGFTLYLLPGTHVIELYYGTDHAERRAVELEAGGKIEIVTVAPPTGVPPETSPPPPQVAPEPRPPPAPETPPAPPGGSPTPAEFPTTWVASLGGATLASFALPLALGLNAANERRAALRLSPGHSRYADGIDDVDKAKRAYRISYSLPVGLAAATTSVVVVHFIRANGADTTGDRLSLGLSPTGVSAFGRF